MWIMEGNTAKLKGRGRFAAIGFAFLSAFLSTSKYEPQRPHTKIILQSESIIHNYLLLLPRALEHTTFWLLISLPNHHLEKENEQEYPTYGEVAL